MIRAENVSELEFKFIKFCKKELHIFPKTPVLIAVSSGRDSMTLLHLFKHFKWNCAVAHCNFSLRAEDSILDEIFVKEWCDKNEIPFYSITFQTQNIAQAQKKTIQETARELRYSWFEQIRKEHNFEYVATAHHANDSVETVLYNIIKGTGIKGLQGIKAKNGNIIRPFIRFEAQEISDYAALKNIPFREDKSNAETKYTRNFIRHEVLPLLKKINENAVKAIAEKAVDWGETNILFEELIQKKAKQLLVEKNNYKSISIAALQQSKAPETLLYYALQPFGFNAAQAKDIFSVSEEVTASGKMIESHTHIVFRDRKTLLISEKNKHIWQSQFLQKKDAIIPLEHCSLELHFLPKNALSEKNFSNKNEIVLDADKLEFPLLMRHWQLGDYMYCGKGKPKKKKLSDIFIQEKWNILMKKAAIIICSGDKIVAAPALCADARFAPSSSTKKILKLHFKQH